LNHFFIKFFSWFYHSNHFHGLWKCEDCQVYYSKGKLEITKDHLGINSLQAFPCWNVYLDNSLGNHQKNRKVSSIEEKFAMQNSLIMHLTVNPIWMLLNYFVATTLLRQ
jgi:hypothetical protein